MSCRCNDNSEKLILVYRVYRGSVPGLVKSPRGDYYPRKAPEIHISGAAPQRTQLKKYSYTRTHVRRVDVEVGDVEVDLLDGDGVVVGPVEEGERLVLHPELTLRRG